MDFTKPEATGALRKLWKALKNDHLYMTKSLLRSGDLSLYKWVVANGGLTKICADANVPTVSSGDYWSISKANKFIDNITKEWGYRPNIAAVQTFKYGNSLKNWLSKNKISYTKVGKPSKKNGYSHQENWVKAVVEKLTGWTVLQDRYFCLGNDPFVKDDVFQVDLVVIEKKLVIEVHGSQHFEMRTYDDEGAEKLKQTQIRDKMRKKAIRANGWHLVEINYKQQSPEIIESMIKEFMPG